MKPIRATYGEQDNSHKLLSCDGSVSLPSDLEGLTDRPAGNIAPGEYWWPTIGCGPVGDWWALWWTEPDTEAERGGMVRSEVALWPLSEIGKLEDLTPVFDDLSGGSKFQTATLQHIELAAGALIAGEKQPLLICDDLSILPSILIRLWRQMWPTARADFSIRVALIPPASGTHNNAAKMLAIPKVRENQWQDEYSKINLVNAIQTPRTTCRATRYLVGEDDSMLSEVVREFSTLTPDLTYLRRLARIAEGIDKLSREHNFADALALLRTLNIVAPDINAGKKYKAMALSALSGTITDATRQQIEAMANLDLSKLSETNCLQERMHHRVSELIPTLSKEEGFQLLRKLLPAKANPWWQRNVKSSLKAGLLNLTEAWATRLLYWLSAPEFDQVLSGLISANKDTELQLLLVAEKHEWDMSDIAQLRNQSTAYSWSQLHAWCAMKTMSVADAFDAQFGFVGETEPGLNYLAKKIPPSEVVSEAVDREDVMLINLAASLTIADPSLLNHLNVAEQSSRKLWVTHIEAGGQRWSDNFTPATKGRELLTAVLSGQDSCGLLDHLAADLAEIVLDHPEREQLWSRINPSEAKAMVPLIADTIIARINNGEVIIQPEQLVTDAVIMKVRSSTPSAKVFCRLMSWGVNFGENEVIHWVEQFTPKEWQETAQVVGRLAKSSNWGELAKKLNNLSNQMAEVKPAIAICHDLLPFWDRFCLNFSDSGRNVGSPEQTEKNRELVNVVADIGSQLHPDGLDELWERTGGHKRDLEYRGTPKDRWQQASRLAAQGSNNGGLKALVAELLNEYPENTKLKKVSSLIIDAERTRETVR